MAWYKFVAKLSHLSFSFLKKLTDFLDAFFSGFWLGVMGEKSLDYSDELYYNRNKSYTTDKYNESGFFKWEKPLIEKYFQNAKSILLIAAGGGREVLSLSKMGFEVDSYECNLKLIEYGNGLLEKNGIKNRIKYLPMNSVPMEVRKYDGIIIGWGAYSLMKGTKKRIAFLQGLIPFLHSESKLMISFLFTGKRSRKERIIKRVSDFFGFLNRKEKTEPGDRLVPDFIHYFTEEEIRNELTQAKLNVLEYCNTEYGCLIAAV